ncbi:oxygenase MpaB family protein [Saccharopolyspora sp. 5N102]|uniref:oxygenase MpaB family protein n=1 Tax=Saccharopolyspora sp. 5N102 TaxID=3375155 RepID=UPI003787AF82
MRRGELADGGLDVVYQRDPLGRLRRTAGYFITVVFGDGRSVVTAADRLRRVHDRVTRHDPISGIRYAANEPENQLWVHMTTWHSVLYCYERYGPGPLAPEREREYWRGCQISSELQGLDPAEVPGSRTEVREYFASMRPRMCVSEDAREIIDWLLKPTSSELRLLKPVFVLLARAAAATLPPYMRDLGGFNRSRVVDGAVAPMVRMASRVMTLRPLRRIGAAVSPEAYALRVAAAFGPVPSRNTTVTIAEARRQLANEPGDGAT